MKKKLLTLISLSTLALGVSSCLQESVLDNSPGKYEKTTNSTDADGTTTKKQSSTVVDVDANGNKTAVIKSKTTRDPKGLFNKTTTSESKQTIEETK